MNGNFLLQKHWAFMDVCACVNAKVIDKSKFIFVALLVHIFNHYFMHFFQATFKVLSVES